MRASFMRGLLWGVMAGFVAVAFESLKHRSLFVINAENGHDLYTISYFFGAFIAGAVPLFLIGFFGGLFPRVARTSWSVILSLPLPGLGQILVRSFHTGIIIIIISITLSLSIRVIESMLLLTPITFIIALTLVFLRILIVLFAAVDAGRKVLKAEITPVKWYRSTWFVGLIYIAILVSLSHTRPTGWRSFSIPSSSMEPTLTLGDRFMINALGHQVVINRGDIVIFKLSKDKSIDFVKRVIGMPGDTVQITNGQLYINSVKVNQADAGNYTANQDGTLISTRKYVETLINGKTYMVIKSYDNGFMNNTPVYTVPI